MMLHDDYDVSPRILVVHDIEEIRDGIETLLKTNGYQVDAARGTADAGLRASLRPPNLILSSSSGSHSQLIQTAKELRMGAGLSEEVLVVIFCSDALAQGEEVAIDKNIYITRPDNFNQLRALLERLLV